MRKDSILGNKVERKGKRYLIEVRLNNLVCYGGICDEIEKLSIRHDCNPILVEECVEVTAVHSQEIQGIGMVLFDRL